MMKKVRKRASQILAFNYLYLTVCLLLFGTILISAFSVIKGVIYEMKGVIAPDSSITIMVLNVIGLIFSHVALTIIGKLCPLREVNRLFNVANKLRTMDKAEVEMTNIEEFVETYSIYEDDYDDYDDYNDEE